MAVAEDDERPQMPMLVWFNLAMMGALAVVMVAEKVLTLREGGNVAANFDDCDDVGSGRIERERRKKRSSFR